MNLHDIPGGVMYQSNRSIDESVYAQRKRLRMVLTCELAEESYCNAWVTLSWLTNLPPFARKKVRLRKTDVALMTLEAASRTQRDFAINWQEVTCV